MGKVRTIVFPALRLLVWAVIAVALAVLAFRGGTGDEADPAGPAAAPAVDLSSPVVPVSRGTVTNTVTVQGSVVADAPVPVKATAAGTVSRLYVAAGATVAVDDKLLDIRHEEERDPIVGTDAEGNPTSTPRDPLVTVVTVRATSAGRLDSLDVLKDQIVTVGDKVGAVSPGTLSVTAPLAQADQFRLLSPPATAEVTVTGGPAPFTCTGLTLGAPAAAGESAGTDPMTGAPITATTTARCAVPPGVTVFPGMAATVAITAGEVADALVVPVTAVQGAVQAGTVWVPGADGTPEERPVTLGLTDGQQVEITGGLAEGDEVLEFVPVPDDTVVGPSGGYGGYGG